MCPPAAAFSRCLRILVSTILNACSQAMNPWIYDIINKLDEASEDELRHALDELEYLYDALGDIDREIAERCIAKLTRQLEQLRGAI